MTVLLIIFIIILFFAAVLSIPVYLTLDYSDTATVYVEWTFIKFKLYPFKKKAKTENNVSNQNKEEKKENNEHQNDDGKKSNNGFIKDFYECQGIYGIISFINNCAVRLKRFSNRFLKSFYFSVLDIDIKVTEDDAAATAIKYGKICSGLYPTIGFIASACKIKKYNINILADYCGVKTNYKFYTKIAFIPRKIINASVIFGLSLLIQLLKVVFKNIKIKNSKLKGGN